MSAIVNRRDLSFLLFDCFNLDSLCASERYAVLDRSTVESILDTAQQVAEERYLPFAAALDAHEPTLVDGKVAMMPQVREALSAYAEAGFFAAAMDTAQGGLQLPYVVSMAINGMFAAANLPVNGYAFLTIANANLLATFGSDEQRATFLPPMLEGRWFGTMCLSEPQAGSSLSDISTRAVPKHDGTYSIVGNKMWISGADHELSENIIHLVLAKIPGGPPGVKGISLFIVPKYRVGPDGSLGANNNIALAGLNHKMGQRGIVNGLLNFGEQGETIGLLVGKEHEGLAYMFHMMNEARIGVGHHAVMSGLAGFLYSLDYAGSRPQGRILQDKDPCSPQVPIIAHADVKRMLMAQKAAVEGALALSIYCALLVDRQKVATDDHERHELGLLLDLLTPVAKSWPCEHCLEANKHAIQVLGGYGYTREYPVERFYRDNRLNHIHEGTFGIQAIDLLGRKVRMDDGAALRLLFDRMEATIALALASPLAGEADRLREAVVAMQSATTIASECADRELALANATLYLDGFGHVVVAWLWLHQAITAAALPPDAFTEGKLAACRYFFRYELPKVHAQFELVAALDDTCLTASPASFVGA